METQKSRSYIDYVVRVDLDLIHSRSHHLRSDRHRYSIVSKNDQMSKGAYARCEDND